jgi:type IV secretion system protein TrbL
MAADAACSAPALAPGLSVAACAAGSVLSGAASSVAGAASSAVLGPLADAMFSAWWTLQAKVMTFWTTAPTPTAADLVGPGSSRGYVAWLSQVVLVCSILAAAARTILTRDARNLADAGRVLVTTILVSAAGIAVAVALVKAGDAIAAALLSDALATSAAADQSTVEGMLANGGGPGASMLLGILGTLACLVQFFVLLARNAVLPVVVLLLPLAAASGGTALGKAWFSKLAAWLLALAFYKPVAAAIYAVVLTQARDADTAMKAVVALVGMFTAVLAMPALIKLFSPNPAGGGGGGGGYAFGMAAGAATRAATSKGGTP